MPAYRPAGSLSSCIPKLESPKLPTPPRRSLDVNFLRCIGSVVCHPRPSTGGIHVSFRGLEPLFREAFGVGGVVCDISTQNSDMTIPSIGSLHTLLTYTLRVQVPIEQGHWVLI